MIKVNLLKNRGTVADSGTQFDFTAPAEFSNDRGASGSPAESIVKVAMIFVFPLLLWGYESYNIGQLTSSNASVQNRLTELQAEVDKNAPIIERATKMQTEIKELEDRIAIIKNLSKIRLREIKAIDFLQNVMPEKIWFQEMDFRDAGFKVTGFAVTGDALNKFIESIDGKSYFRNVVLMSSEDKKTKAGTIKGFVVGSSMVDSD